MSEDKWIVCVYFMKDFMVISPSHRWTGDMKDAKEFDSIDKAKDFRDIVGAGAFVDLHPRCRYE